MKRIWAILPLLAALGPCLAQAAPGPAGSVVSTVGQVLVKGAQSADSPAKVGQSLYAGESLVTGADSAAKLLLADETILDIGASTSFRIEALEEGASEDRRVNLGVDLGSVRASVN